MENKELIEAYICLFMGKTIFGKVKSCSLKQNEKQAFKTIERNFKILFSRFSKMNKKEVEALELVASNLAVWLDVGMTIIEDEFEFKDVLEDLVTTYEIDL